jgi:Flp pilus assembly protein TadG
MNPIAKRFAAPLRSLRDRARRGIAAVEFALTLPVMMVLLLGAADGTYYLLICERADRIAYTVTDIVTQNETVTIANLKDILMGAEQLMEPFNFGTQGVVVISSVYQPTSGSSVIKWQYTGGGTLSKTSKVGSSGGTATLPNGLALNANDNVIVTEVYYSFTPLFAPSELFPAKVIYRAAVYKPRLSALTTPPT